MWAHLMFAALMYGREVLGKRLTKLIQLLHKESELIDVAVRMLSECGTTRLQKTAYS